MSSDKQPTEVPATEVTPGGRRRSFTAEYKRQILREADACTKPGEVGALLRREGLYSSRLTEWRYARDRGELAGDTRPRGPKPQVRDARDERIEQLERDNAQLEKRAWRAESLMEIQKKVLDLLGNLPQLPEASSCTR